MVGKGGRREEGEERDVWGAWGEIGVEGWMEELELGGWDAGRSRGEKGFVRWMGGRTGWEEGLGDGVG